MPDVLREFRKKCLDRVGGRSLRFKFMLTCSGLAMPFISQGQQLDIRAGYVHGWGANWVVDNAGSSSPLANGWKASAAWNFGADTVAHLSLGGGWMSMNWRQEFTVLHSPLDALELKYTTGTMETRMSQLCVTPELVVPISHQFRFVFGADLGWLVHAEQNLTGTETHSTEWHSPSHPGGTETFAVDSTYDVDMINRFLFGIHVGFEFIPAKHWSIRTNVTPWVSNVFGPDHSVQVPVYLDLTVGYRFIHIQG